MHVVTDAKSQRSRSRSGREDPGWQTHLPPEWRAQVDAPLEVHRYQDYEMAAERVIGYDADEKPCYTAYRFSLLEPRSDDGREFYTVLTYGEELAAWRLHDERWLVWRKIHARGERRENDQARSFYCLAQEMPR
jgi:hypothetical protein